MSLRFQIQAQTQLQRFSSNLLLAGLLLSTISCSAVSATDMTKKKDAMPAANSAAIPATFNFGYHQPTTLKEGMTIEVTEVSDSRCPPNTRCAWAGQATVSFKVSQPGKPDVTLVIGTPAPPAMNLPADACYGVYRFSLMALEPKKGAGESVAAEAYKAEIKITKAEATK